MLNLEQPQGHASWSWCYKYLFPTQSNSCCCLKFYFSAHVSLLDLLNEDFCLVALKSHLGVPRKKKEPAAKICWFHTAQNGRVTSQDWPYVCLYSLCKSVFRIHNPWKEENTTSTFLTGFMERINEFISIKYFASHRWLANMIRTTFFLPKWFRLCTGG